MLDRPEFEKKQIVFLFSNQGDKLSFKMITLSLPLRTVQSNTKLPATGYFLYLLLERLQ